MLPIIFENIYILFIGKYKLYKKKGLYSFMICYVDVAFD